MSDGRSFGLTVGAAFVALAAIAVWRVRMPVAIVFATVGATLLVLGAWLPAMLIPVRAAWMRGAEAFSRVTTPVFIGLVFFAVFLPIGLVMRLRGRNSLVHARSPEAGFWHLRSPGARRGNLNRQF